MLNQTRRLVCVAAVVIVLSGQAVLGAVRYVKADATGANNGGSWTDAYTDLQAALAAAQSGDEIWVASGTYKPTSGADRTKSFVMRSGVGMYGGFAGGETAREQRNWVANVVVLSGDIGVAGSVSDNSYHVVVGASNAVLDGFTVTGGYANGSGADINGGGMINDSVSPTIRNCTFTGNSAARDLAAGGGIFNNGASPTVTNCAFNGNYALGWGGGMYNGGGSPTVTGCTFTNNVAQNGGGMENYSNASLTVTNCAFFGNVVCNGGGGMQIRSSSPRVTGCTFADNRAAWGGGIRNFGMASPTVTNCAFSGNSAQQGGGMFNYAGSPTVANCTFTSNTASNDGGGLVNSTKSHPVIPNTIFWGDSAKRGNEVYNDASCLVLLTHSLVGGSGGSGAGWDADLGQDGGGNIDANPRFVDAAHPAGPDGLWRTGDDGLGLRTDSPCVDAGTTDGAPADDILGDPRVGAPDIGAYEFQPASHLIIVISPSNGESWQQLTAQTIRWVSAGDCGSNVRIVFFKAGQWERTFQTETPNDGVHPWSVPPDVTPGTDYQIKVVSTSVANCSGLSGVFSIAAAAAGVQVSCPNTWVDWQRRSTVRIRWTSWGDVGGQVKINLFRGRSQWVRTISLSTPNSGDYLWTIPGDVVPHTDYRIKITPVSKPQYYDFSDQSFSIHAENAAGTSWRRY